MNNLRVETNRENLQGIYARQIFCLEDIYEK